MRFMLDTDTCIFISRRKSTQVISRFASLPEGDVGISVVTYGELRFGAEKSRDSVIALDVLKQLLGGVPVLPLGPDVCDFYGKARLDLQQRGQIIGSNDLWIAAHCLQLGLTLVTNNEREFRRIPNLRIENWTK